MTAILLAATLAASEPALVPPAPPPAAASGASGHLDPAAATRAYLDLLPREQREKSDAYFEGGYWLILWNFLWSAAISLLLLQTGWSVRMRDLSRRFQTLVYWLQFVAVTFVLELPLAFYRGYLREHRYGLSNLTFSGWVVEELKGLLVSAIFGGLAVMVLYAVVRRLARTWWIWGAAVTIAFFVFGAAIAPVVITPLFNSPKRLQDQRVVAPILSLARANGIDAHEVWEIDASKQSKRVSANVSGFAGTQRITLNDNLLNRCSLPEIEAVMGHEMGHYVLNHVYKLIMEFGILIVIGFALLRWAYDRLAPRWNLQGIGDVAGLPLVTLILSAYFFVLTPVTNTIIRVGEQEADMFGLNAARQPDGFAQTALKLSEYRKLEPGPAEEAIFFDHPSGRTRIYSAMRWKAEHPETWAR